MDQEFNTEPMTTVQLSHGKITILGTAHVSKASAITVRNLIDSDEYDAVAVELCQNRYTSIVDPDAITRMDLFQAIKTGRIPMITSNLVLGAFQQRIADQVGVEPGADMRSAISKAEEKEKPLILIDREIGITLKRIYRNIPWYQRIKLFSALIASIFSSQKIDEDEIEKLKQGDILESSFTEFAEKDLDLFKPLIDERDQFMAAKLLKETKEKNHKNTLAVVGAGHMKGIARYLTELDAPDKKIKELNQIPQGSKWLKIVPWIIVAIILIGFGIGFLQDSKVGWENIKIWILYNGIFCAVGAALATAHPLTIITAFVAAPITSLNPLIGAGMVTGAVETYLRQPNVKDFTQLRHDASSVGGWWKNRVTRILLVFMFSSLGSAIATWVAGAKIIANLT